MPCDKCGKQNCNGKCGTSPSVLQINNNNCTLFHRVDVPAAMGDEKVNPPKTGAYRNVLLYYEASGNSYLYSSDGIPTKLTGVVNDYEVLLNKPWINGVELIGHKTLEDLGITGAISGAVAAEKAAREAADTALSNRITANTNAITAETTARQNADTALSNRIATNTNNIATNTANIATNTSNIAANTTAIANEVTARKNADTSLSNRISSNSAAITGETIARQNADTALGNRIDGVYSNISAEATARENADDALSNRIDAVAATASTAVQPDDINRTVMTDISVDSSSSSTQVKLKESKVNLKTGATSSQTTTLPVASSTTAGVMNAATYDAVSSNTSNINAILGGAVAINGLPASPSQSALTSAWQAETGLSTLINRASIYDVTNSKVWTYYTNDTTWYATTSASTITVNTFTNTSEGVIKGSTADGQVFAENDGTGSVNGWDALSSDVANATSKLANIQDGAEVNVQANWNETSTSSDAFIKNKPTIGDATLTIQKNGTNVQTFTANSTSNKTANITVPTKTSELTNDSGFIEDDTHAVCDEGSDIYLEGTTVEPLEFHNVGGDATQETLSGKNLMPMATYDADAGRSSSFRTNMPTGTYTVSFTLDSFALGTNTSSAISMQMFYEDETSKDNTILALDSSTTTGRKSFTFTTTKNVVTTSQHSCNIRIALTQYENGARAKLSDIMIESGSSMTDYEPYCGGVPMPNPQFPSDVKTVSGLQTVKITGKNLWGIESEFDRSQSAVDFKTMPDGSIYMNGTATGTAFSMSSTDALNNGTWVYLTAGTYTLSVEPALKSGVSAYLFNTDNIQIGSTLDWNHSSRNYTIEQDTKVFVRLRVSSGTTNEETYKFMLVKGSTAEPFEPYQSQSQEINLGKNLIKTDSLSTRVSGGLTTTWADNVGDTTGTATGTSVLITDSITTGVYLPIGTYTFSVQTAATQNMSMNLYNADTSAWVTVGTIPAGSLKYTFTTTFKATGWRIGYAGLTANTSYTLKCDRPMLEAGSQASSYSPYKTPLELAKIGTYQDYIYKSGNKWYKHSEIGKVVLDGSEANWAGDASYGGYFRAHLSFADIAPIANSGDFVALSDYFHVDTGVLWSGTIQEGMFCQFRDTTDVYFAPPLSVQTKQNWLDWLASHNTTVYYALNTPTDTEITDAELIGQLNALWEADGYDGATSITVIPGETQAAILSVCQYPSHLPVATKYKIGAVVVGHGLDIEPDGRLDVVPATENAIGGIKVGENLSITEDGVLSADAQHIDVDSALSTTSENPVQNKVVTAAINSKQDTLSTAQINATNSGITSAKVSTYDGYAAAIASKADASSLAPVATSGSYNDLTNKPTIPAAQVNSDWNANSGVARILNKPTLATVATSGSYNDLSNKPAIPTVNNATLTIQKNGTTVKTFTANASSNVTANITVPTKTSELTNNSGFITGYTETDPVFSASPAATITTQDIDSWTAKSNFSGSYNDLTDKPTIPTVNNATLTIQKNGTNVQTFTANSSTNKTANLEIPVITLTNIDPGEGGSLAANNFIGVYI